MTEVADPVLSVSKRSDPQGLKPALIFWLLRHD